MLPWRAALSPIPRPDPAAYSAATIEHGRIAAAIGGCVTCHTGPDGRLAGGLALDTPFGRIWSTNITPDPEAGIGAWSYPAFERAMREGVSRDGHHLYPAHPYTAFAKADDADLQALYGYLMAQEPNPAAPPRTDLGFPFNLRPLLAGWNALFLRGGGFEQDPARSSAWNRGAYLVEGLGHCGACHTPRNALGAERGGHVHLGGAIADGWEAPALTTLSHAPIPWTEEALFAYLRTGMSPHHGVAAGPMGSIVANLKAVPDDDIRSMAVYLASLSGTSEAAVDADTMAARLVAFSGPSVAASEGARLYEGACAACHEAAGSSLFGARPALALSSNLHSATPTNLIRIVLDGVHAPADSELGFMPGFADSLDDEQIAALLTYLRSRFAQGARPWAGIEGHVTAVRNSTFRNRLGKTN